MITQDAAEKFLQSKLALFVGMLFCIGFLTKWKIDDSNIIADQNVEKRFLDSVHKKEINRLQEVIYNIQEQQKIKDYNAAQAQIIQNEKDKERLERLIYVEREARKLKIIK